MTPHDVVVELAQPVFPRRVPLKRLSCEVVVVCRIDVGVAVATRRVGMNDHEVVSGVHPFDEIHSHVADAVEVILVRDIELVGREAEHVGLKLDSSPVGGRKCFDPFDEVQRSGVRVACDADRERCSPCFTVALAKQREGLVSVTEERVGDGACSIVGGSDVNRAHVRVLSPSDARTSTTAAATSLRSATSGPPEPAW